MEVQLKRQDWDLFREDLSYRLRLSSYWNRLKLLSIEYMSTFGDYK